MTLSSGVILDLRVLSPGLTLPVKNKLLFKLLCCDREHYGTCRTAEVVSQVLQHIPSLGAGKPVISSPSVCGVSMEEVRATTTTSPQVFEWRTSLRL